MKLMKTTIASSLLALAMAASPALADGPVAERSGTEEQASFAADRETILAMAGDYRVRFDMQESTPWREGYEPLERKISGGHESVRVIEDTGTRIVLQHLLVVDAGGTPMVIKHWRQDWEYEPARILAYEGPGRWAWEEVPERMRAGRWAQTVWQVDDSPRYAGWGQWETTNGVRRWRSNWTQRPLARRDAVRNLVYDLYAAINRHQLTPDGWIHWQDNTKMDLVEGGEEPVVQEYVLNTYTRFADYEVSAADEYWAATQGYWQAVRAEWDRVAQARGGIAIEEEAQTGTVISAELLGMGDDILSGSLPEAEAIARAVTLIEEHTTAL
ncbi:DUF6607 family protein [Alteraurantiacibacter aquimixticola]|uniref:Uncharacterized protein n=1 Tax=Alteraurantiacibacter aquimixticola TaxID=2489173 RepID=A0A4T3F2T3_9SPHN|nr:DUF6607 family protein [Alteraurantiacibacter aquimixticola]TIX49735.1 hypothetical protein E5222_13050 [Alteraurantiacibacter aquimixticola]